MSEYSLPGEAFTQRTLPSLGFFGASWADSLCVNPVSDVSALEVRILGEHAEFLNLRGVSVSGANRRVLAEAGYRVQQSSQRFESQFVPQGPVQLTGIHTLKELNPYWRIDWLVPQQIDSVRLFNRTGPLGKRSRQMRVTVWDSSGDASVLYDSASPQFLDATLNVLAGLSGLQPAEFRARAKADRGQAIRAVADGLRTLKRPLDRHESLAAFAMIPTTPSAVQSVGMDDDGWFVLAFLLCSQVHANPASRSSIFAFAALLDTKARLGQLEACFGAVAGVLGSADMYIAKHGIAVRSFGESELRAMHEAVDKLVEDSLHQGIDVTLGYGTLLGAIREGGPIAHDDDFDLFAPIQASSHEEFVRGRIAYMAHLESCGWEVTPNDGYYNFHVRLPDSPTVLDVFGIHLDGEDAFGHMERATWRRMPAVWFRSQKYVPFAGAEREVIVGADAFLEERYGPTWRTPDRFHEWRWPLVG